MNDVPPTKVMLYNLKQLFYFLYLLLAWSVCADYKVILRKRVLFVESETFSACSSGNYDDKASLALYLFL